MVATEFTLVLSYAGYGAGCEVPVNNRHLNRQIVFEQLSKCGIVREALLEKEQVFIRAVVREANVDDHPSSICRCNREKGCRMEESVFLRR